MIDERQPRRILIVDDNSDAAESLGMLLELEGHTVRCAFDGPSALQISEHFNPEVCLLDIGLPGMDGYELARHLRITPQAQGALFIALSGYSRNLEESPPQGAAFKHYLVKPVDPQVLAQLLWS